MGLDRGRWAAAALAWLCLPAAAHATDIAGRGLGGEARGGSVRATVCAKANFLQPHCRYSGRAEAGHGGAVVVRVPGVPPGTYAVQVFHDVDDNGRITQNLFGIPTEGVGFSRDAPIRFGPPRFADAQIAVSGALVTIDINLKFEP